MNATAWAAVSALAAVLTAAIAAWSLITAARDSAERTRPLVTAFLRRGPSYSHGVIYLVVRNSGTTAARDLRVTFDPALPTYEHTDDGQPGIVAPILRRRYGSPMAVLAPGESLANIYYYSGQGPGNIEPVADRFEVTVSYQGRKRKRFVDTFTLDRESISLETATSPGSGNDVPKRTAAAIEAAALEIWSGR